MDADRRNPEMTDAALDRELQSLLDVDPSPAFVARVRARIADEPPRSAWWPPAFVLGGLAAAAALVIVVAVSRSVPRGTPSDVPPLASRALASAPIEMPDVVARRSSVRMATQAVPRGAHAHADTTTGEIIAARQAEVLVDPREAAAIRAVIVRARGGRIDLAPVLQASTPTAMDLGPVVELAIPEITIDPIAPAPGAEGVRQ